MPIHWRTKWSKICNFQYEQWEFPRSRSHHLFLYRLSPTLIKNSNATPRIANRPPGRRNRHVLINLLLWHVFVSLCIRHSVLTLNGLACILDVVIISRTLDCISVDTIHAAVCLHYVLLYRILALKTLTVTSVLKQLWLFLRMRFRGAIAQVIFQVTDCLPGT